ncbi:2Fe-2S iron-sulfur cluster binding domain-containing protein [Pseudaminobacter sp. 19-2017]|uniref:2Fe-2S iron-sulfur cluster binding domain-containing protein n=1 Tax=Pseudaminobacter soli (ex Zhang et al. 2022) TaxID=2831468 RepID=A0A942E6Z5_9HYPH|nr:2Fe-2S iron-sulfur cluster binding domain-containing protein [Pseudaminobacter soli]
MPRARLTSEAVGPGASARTQTDPALNDTPGVCKTVLQVVRASGVRIPAACETGLCGSCKIRKASVEVEMHHSGRTVDEEIAEGFILACCFSRGPISGWNYDHLSLTNR